MKLYPSLMCISWDKINSEIEALNKTEIYGYHIDVMDGSFVPTFGLGVYDIKAVSNLTNKEIDVHLMINNPENHIEQFIDAGATMIAFHIESTSNAGNVLMKIKNRGIKAGVVINPATSINLIEPILSELDYVIVMTVNPGYAGQKYLNYVDTKIEQLINLIRTKRFDCEIYVDGAISEEIIERLSKYGVEGFILGTSTLFNKLEEYKEIIDRVMKLKIIE